VWIRRMGRFKLTQMALILHKEGPIGDLKGGN
jgi:hypothetical protein